MAYYRYMYPIIAYFFYSFNRWENEKFKNFCRKNPMALRH